MADSRNVAHAKKVTQEKKHHGTDASPPNAHAVQPGKKAGAEKKKSGAAGGGGVPDGAVAGQSAGPTENRPKQPPAALEGSLVVLAKLKELEFHSRAHLERLAELALTVDDELKQQEIVKPLDEVYSAQNAVQTKLTALIEAYKAECDRLQGGSV